MKQKIRAIDAAKLIYVGVIFLASLYLFYNQGVTPDRQVFLSDLPDHIAFAMTGDSYSFMYLIMGLLLKLPRGRVFAIAAFEALLVVGAGWITYLLLKKMVSEDKKTVAFFAAFSLLFLTSMYLPGIYEKYYWNTFAAQPWHNITYVGMRFFALWTMYSFFEVYENYLEGIGLKQWIKIALPLLLGTAIKPNFLLSFAFALLAILIIDYVRYFLESKKLFGNIFWNIVKMGTVVFPACFALLVQAVILYGPSESGAATSSVILTWGATLFKDGVPTLILKTICSLAFPILIYVCNHKQFDKSTNFAYLMFLVTFVQVHMLDEAGARAGHGNFTWGIYNAAYIVFIYALGYFMEHIDLKNKKAEAVAGIIMLGIHLISGFTYFVLLLQGGLSYCL